jgi:uncharacterized NAD(P)/FAD-binding protein YdhS
MKRLNKFVAVLGLASVLVAGSSSVFAKSESRQRLISGSIVSIDRDARTMTVREAGTSRTVVVQVPAGSRIRTNVTSGGSYTFEQLLAGMSVRELAVE